MRGCSSQNSPGAMQVCEPGSAIWVGIRSPLCSRANRNGDARNARVSSSAAGRILRSAQASVSWSSPAGSRNVNSNSVLTDGRADSWQEDSSGPFTDLGGPRHPRPQTAYPLWAQVHRGVEERINLPAQVPAGCHQRGSRRLNCEQTCSRIGVGVGRALEKKCGAHKNQDN